MEGAFLATLNNLHDEKPIEPSSFEEKLGLFLDAKHADRLDKQMAEMDPKIEKYIKAFTHIAGSTPEQIQNLFINASNKPSTLAYALQNYNKDEYGNVYELISAWAKRGKTAESVNDDNSDF